MRHQVVTFRCSAATATQRALTWLVVLAPLAACNPPREAVAPPEQVSVDPIPPELATIDAAQLAQFLRDHRGEVVLIDFWATWCPPCVEGLPHTVELHRKYADRGVAVATVAIDAAEQRSTIESLLAALKPGDGFSAFLAADGANLVSAMDAFEIQSGTLPTLRLYDRAGTLYRTFGDGDPEPIRFEEVEIEIRSLLRDDAFR